jgi:ABC transporter transmembrane region
MINFEIFFATFLFFRTNWEEAQNVTEEFNKTSTTIEFDFMSMTWMNTEFAIYVYTGIIVATLILSLFRSYLFFNLCMRASVILHNTMFSSITRATMAFFNANSSGNRLIFFFYWCTHHFYLQVEFSIVSPKTWAQLTSCCRLP